ncbi:protein LYK5 isoform X1 [Selaginella moellendorffii]|uniref:protein LYK5 isoform X1 n=2 Tax=Selaginella moellendorffii TaxID=88036 RepID=UPI000D1C2DA8|nr:protein LYK5 isoform X1 [Selaginella moellendorffii]|eukprot:XP_024535082.1 protein LYK5 isoform X1 [Selaginella moellendorffii]
MAIAGARFPMPLRRSPSPLLGMISTALLVLLLLWSDPSANAQQAYIESDQEGYSCVSNSTSCQAYAAYRALQGDTLQSVGLRFRLSVEQLAEASQIAQSATLVPDQVLLIPLNCSCASGRSQFNATYIIQSGDTLYLVSNGTFQGLTTYQAVERANPLAVPTNLQPGDSIVFPIRCACPSSAQVAAGVTSLVTYSIWPGEILDGIARAWNVSRTRLASDNTVSGSAVQDSNLQAFTTLLLRASQDPPPLPRQTLSPAAPPPANNPPNNSPSPDSSSSSGSNTGMYVGIAVACVAAVLLVVLALVIFYRRRPRKVTKASLQKSSYGHGGSKDDRNFGAFGSSVSSSYAEPSKEQPSPHAPLLAGMHGLVDSERPVVFSYEELCDATNNFSASHLIQGSVYRGILRKQLVAIKEMKGGTTSQELKILCKVHHSNLVKLIGICSGDDKLFLVYEYADNGSLSSCLHNRTPAATAMSKIENAPMGSASVSSAFLSWNTRLQVAMDVATGLEYIHDYTKPSFVHKDVKSSNILLDANLRAKVANFGMARLVNDAALTKHIAGTQGYMSPEYLTHGFVTTKVDVYAFGVVLLELFTGREAILSTGTGSEKQYLADAFVKLTDGFAGDDNDEKIEKLKHWADPILDNAVPWDIALNFVEVARSCVDADPDARPNTKDVTFKLSKLLESSLEWETAAVLSRRYNTAPLEGR